MAPTDSVPQHYVLEDVNSFNIDDWLHVSDFTLGQVPAGHSCAFHEIFYPRGMPPAFAATDRAKHVKSCDDKDNYYKLIRDTSLPNSPCIGTACWKIYPAKSADQMLAEEEQRSRNKQDEQHDPDIQQDRLECFRKAQFKGALANVADRPYMYLKTITTHPDHQRKGVGKILMRWGLKRADELGLPIYLEASPAGRRLYEQCGFVSKGTMDWDARRFEGIVDSFENLLMLREPGTGEVKY